MKTHYKRTTCRLCQSGDVELAVPIKASPIADAYIPANRCDEKQELFPLDLYLCNACGHVQLLDVVNPEVLFRDYIYTTSVSLGLVEHFRRYADDVLHRFPAVANSLAVDIGSNDGTLLKFFKAKGLRVLGIDPAANIAKQATQAGVETMPSFFTSDLAAQIKNSHGEARLVTANNVFAHSDQLADMADGIRELLAHDGVFVFEVSYLVDIVEKFLFDTVYHEHLCYHSIKPFENFFRLHGLELIDVQRLPTKGGSIRGFVQRRGGPHKRMSIVDELIALENKMGLDRSELYKEYTGKIEAVKRELLGMLNSLKTQGKTIAGFGASATVTTLIYNFELGRLLSYLVDDNPARHGLFSPGHHIPVVSSQALYERKPDDVLILAWQYADPILKKHHKFVEEGGAFIVPLPSVRTFAK